MSMLAEKKRKVQYILTPRTAGKEWATDQTQFGHRMLEKMGWKSGSGLGAKEQGMKEILHVRTKFDKVGFGSKKDEDYCVHQNNFEALLMNLSGEQPDSLDINTVTSLERKSQSSKARLHYGKFTRGKDLSRCSTKDLECILGQKKDEETDENNTKFFVVGTSKDYFEQKSKRDLVNTCNDDLGSFATKETNDGDESGVVIQKKKAKSKKRDETDITQSAIDSDPECERYENTYKTDAIGGSRKRNKAKRLFEVEECRETEQQLVRKKKKKSERDVSELCQEVEVGAFIENVDNAEQALNRKQAKKEKGLDTTHLESSTPVESFTNGMNSIGYVEKKLKVNKKKKSVNIEIGVLPLENGVKELDNGYNVESKLKKSRKKRSRDKRLQSNIDADENVTIVDDISDKSKKKKKRKSDIENSVPGEDEVPPSCNDGGVLCIKTEDKEEGIDERKHRKSVTFSDVLEKTKYFVNDEIIAIEDEQTSTDDVIM